MYEKLLEILNNTKFKTKKRKIINDNCIKTMTLGIIHKPFSKYKGFSVETEQNIELYNLIKETFKDHKFTTITINKNVICKPHHDIMNNGITMIIGIGNYGGGGN